MTPMTFVTRTGTVYSARPVSPEQAAAVGCDGDTHVLTGPRGGAQYARWTATTGRQVRMPHAGWADAGRCATHGTFTSWWNNDAPSALPGHLVTHPRPYVPAVGGPLAQAQARGLSR